MRRDPPAGVEHLDRRIGDVGFDQFADQTRRDRVEVIVQFDMVVGCHPAALPLAIGLGLGWKRHQRRPVDAVEEFPPAGAERASSR